MAESLMKDKRVVFPIGEQKKFLLKLHNITGYDWKRIAILSSVTMRTLTDWKREKYSLPFTSYKIFLKTSGLPEPENREIRKPFWWVHNAAVLGGKAVYKKYGSIGDSKRRRKKWLEWWQTKGKFTHKNYFVSKSVVYPRKREQLAEFVGIMLGDGSITKRQIAVTVHYKDDRTYSFFIKKLMKELFGVQPSWTSRTKRSTIFVVISRTKLVLFCKSIGLVVGNKIKQQIDIPQWIYSRISFQKACMRGLMDTDGCIFSERHKIKGKLYCYPRLSLVSASAPLRQSVCSILEKLDFSPKIRNNRSVQLESKEDIIRYFRYIQSHNPKHLQRWSRMNGGVG